MAGFTELKVESIQKKCQDIDVIEDDEFHAKSDMLETTIVNGPMIYSDYKEKDNQKEATGDDDKDLTAEMETLTIDPNKKASGGKRKTKRKNKKSKKSSRKKRKHRKTRKSKK